MESVLPGLQGQRFTYYTNAALSAYLYMEFQCVPTIVPTKSESHVIFC